MRFLPRPSPFPLPLVLLGAVLFASSSLGQSDPMVGRLSVRTLEGVVQQLGTLTDRPILRAVSVPGTPYDFDTRKPLPRSEAIMALQSVLSINGIAVVSVGDFLKLVPVAEVQKHAPDIIEGSTLDLPPSLAYYTKLFEFNFLNARSEIQALISPLMTNGSNVITYPKANAVLLTDTLANLQRIERILLEADRADPAATEVYFVELQHTEASEVANRLSDLLLDNNAALSLPYINNTKIQAEERTNQLIVVTHPDNYDRIAAMVASFDVDVDTETTHLSYQLRFAEEASQVSSILQSLIDAQQEASENAARRTRGQDQPGGEQNRENTQQGENRPQVSIEDPISEGRNLAFSDLVAVVPDERSNSIHATGTPNDLRIIRSLLEKIDVELPQVRIEVVIVDVLLTKNQSSGLDSFSLETGANGIVSFSGLNFGGLGVGELEFNSSLRTSADLFDNLDLAVTVGRSRTNNNVDILATPTILTQHNKEASIEVVEQRPVVSGTTTTDGLRTTDVDLQDVGIELTVKPLIGEGGNIQLEIRQTSDNFGDAENSVDVNGTPQVPILRRVAESFVSMKDGDTIVLGGLRQREVRKERGRLFLLGDLPFFGPFFQPEQNSGAETELLIFVRPTVIRTSIDAADEASRVIQGLDETGDDLRYYLHTGDFPEARLPPYDPLKLKEVFGIDDDPPSRPMPPLMEHEAEPLPELDEPASAAPAGAMGNESDTAFAPSGESTQTVESDESTAVEDESAPTHRRGSAFSRRRR